MGRGARQEGGVVPLEVSIQGQGFRGSEQEEAARGKGADRDETAGSRVSVTGRGAGPG